MADVCSRFQGGLSYLPPLSAKPLRGAPVDPWFYRWELSRVSLAFLLEQLRAEPSVLRNEEIDPPILHENPRDSVSKRVPSQGSYAAACCSRKSRVWYAFKAR